MSKEPAQKPDMFGGPDRSLEPSQGGKAQSAKKGQPRKKEAPKMDLLPLTPDNITAFAPTSSDVSYIHTIFSQCFFPLRPLKNGQKRYEVKHGRGTLLIKAGDLLDPRTGDMVEQDVPSGPAARLVMAHIQNHAKRAPTAEEAACIPMGESMRKFFAQYGKEMGGKQSRQIVQQVNNVAAMHMTIGLWKDNEARQINVPTLAEEIKFWLEKDKRQCTLWQPEMILDSRLVETIRSHAMPYDMRSIVALYKSAREMDMLLFLSYRLPFIPPAVVRLCPLLWSQWPA